IDLKARYIEAPVESVLDFRFLAGVAILAVLVVISVRIRHLTRIPAVALLWLIIALLPVLNLIPIPIWMADRYLYLPSVGFCAAVGAIFAAPTMEKFAMPLAVILVAVMGIGSYQRCNVWSSSAKLWADAADQPEAEYWPPVWLNLAN